MTTESTSQKPFVIQREIGAPQEVAFKAWTDPEQLSWWGPKGTAIENIKLDLRPGGHFHYSMKMPDGQLIWGRWVIRDIQPPARLVFVNSFSDELGGITRHPLAANWPLELLSTITFTAKNPGRTLLQIRWDPLNPSEEEQKTFNAAHDSMKEGWSGSLDQLAEFVETNFLSNAGKTELTKPTKRR